MFFFREIFKCPCLHLFENFHEHVLGVTSDFLKIVKGVSRVTGTILGNCPVTKTRKVRFSFILKNLKSVKYSPPPHSRLIATLVGGVVLGGVFETMAIGNGTKFLPFPLKSENSPPPPSPNSIFSHHFQKKGLF